MRFTKKKASTVKGALMQINTALCGITPAVALLIKIATPLAPPIVKLLAEIREYEAKEIRKDEINKKKIVFVKYAALEFCKSCLFIL